MERHSRESPIPVDNMGQSLTSFGHIPSAGHPSEKIYSFTRVCTLITLILNMVGFDSSIPINCQVRIISPVSPTLGLTKNLPEKLWVIFEVVSHLFPINNDG